MYAVVQVASKPAASTVDPPPEPEPEALPLPEPPPLPRPEDVLQGVAQLLSTHGVKASAADVQVAVCCEPHDSSVLSLVVAVPPGQAHEKYAPPPPPTPGTC